MKKYITTIVIAATMLCACSKDNQTSSQDNTLNNVELSGAEVSTKVDEDGESQEPSNTLFAEGDIVTVVGAAEQSVSFIYLGNDQWRVDRPYQWMDNPTMVYAYYKAGVAVEAGKQIPEFYVASQDCSSNKELSFTADNAFKHATALIRVDINNWTETLAPQRVELKNLHKITYITNSGEYQRGDDLYSIDMELVSQSDNNYRYEARVPAGDATTPNIESGYKLLVDNVNVLDWEADENKIATYYQASKVYTYTLNYEN